MEIILGELNDYTKTWDVTDGVGTLVVSNVIGFDMALTSINRIEDTTTGETFGISSTTEFEETRVSGKPVYTWTFTNLPALTATSDTLLVYLNVSYQQADFATNQHIATKIII